MEILQGEIGYEITLKSLENKTNFMINSPGGSLFEGLAMFDYVKSTDIEVGCIGLCASAATLPLLASSKRFGTPNSRYLIHNPMLSFFLETLTSSELQKNADDLKLEQQKALTLYTQNLSIPENEIIQLMDENKIIDAQEALRIGLIKEIKDINSEKSESELNMIYNKFKMRIDKMENKDLKNDIISIKSVLNDIKNLFITKQTKMLLLQDVNGIEIDFGPTIETPDQIVVGVDAKIDGTPANGEHVMPDGKIYQFENGKLNEIKEAESETDLQVELDTVKAENKTLKAENAQMKLDNEQMKMNFDKKLNEVNMKLNEIQSKFTTEKPTEVVPPANGGLKRR
jgi:ATP-dependent Clp protease, protease subunit